MGNVEVRDFRVNFPVALRRVPASSTITVKQDCVTRESPNERPSSDSTDSEINFEVSYSSNPSSAISPFWISSIIASQSKYGVDDGISRACEPPDNVDIDPHLRTQHR